MPQKIIISEHLRIAALLTDEQTDELIVAQGSYQIGDVFLGTVENVLPGIDAAFVNIGESEKNGFIHVSDLGPLRLKKATAGITELLEPRQKVLVQVMKEPTGTKGPRLTGNLALPGRFLILQPHGQGVNISRRINSETERNRLRALGVLVKPPSTGLLMRTEAENITEELLIDDLENLLKQWDLIQQASESCTPPILLNRDEDFIHRILRDHMGPNVTHVIVEDSLAIDRVKDFLGQDFKDLTIEAHDESKDLFETYRVNSAINDALKPRVDLPSGGYIIIEPTEALTVIDVNSGSFTRSANSRETVLWTNCEAAIEIARQLKLRNIGGVIIIDFIDMDTRRDQLQLLEHFTSAIKDDSARPQIAQLTELGLVELTRKRQGQNIYELFGKPCPNCSGEGHLTFIPIKDQKRPIASEIGIVNSSSGVKNETQILQETNIKKKRIGKIKDPESSSNNEGTNSSSENPPTQSLETISEESSSENQKNKQEPIIIGVNMNKDEEYIYSYMGLNPILILDEPPISENYTVQIIRPGEDKNKVLNEARLTIVNNSTKKRKRNNKNLLPGGGVSNIEQDINLNEIKKISPIQKDNIPKQLEEIAINESMNIEENTEMNNNTESNPVEQVNEDPRRKRRRSSAAS